MSRGAYLLLANLAFILPTPSEAQSPAKIDLEAAEMGAELMAAPVFAADGAEVGEVADISFDDEGQPRRLRIVASAVLGLGTRTLEIPKGTFIALRGAVVLELPEEAVKALPELTERDEEK